MNSAISVQVPAAPVSAPAQPSAISPPVAASRLLGLWPQPQSNSEWLLWLVQGLAPFSALLAMLLSYPNWSTISTPNDWGFRLITGLLGFITFVVWVVFTLYRNIWKNPRGWIAATGCLASPALLIISLAGAFTLVSLWGATKNLSYISLAVCINGLMPLAAVMYFVIRGKRAE